MDRECSETLWFWVRKGSPSTRENAEAPHLIVAFFLVSLSQLPKQSPGSRARAGRSLKLSGRKLITGASFPRWDKPLMLYSLFPPFGPKTDIVGEEGLENPKKGARGNPVLGAVWGGRAQESDSLVMNFRAYSQVVDRWIPPK